jgi:signal peptidase I
MKSLVGIALMAAIFFGCVNRVEETMVFHGTSMRPAIKDGDKLKVERFDRGAKFEVRRGDIVAFLYPKDTSKFYIKRVIGLPGETVEVRERKIIVNGSELNEPYVDPQFNLSRMSQSPVAVEEHSYYVLGDNRDQSSDSRSWGTVPEKNVFARVLDRDSGK